MSVLNYLTNIKIFKRVIPSIAKRILKLFGKNIFIYEFNNLKLIINLNEPMDQLIFFYNEYEKLQMDFLIKKITEIKPHFFLDIGSNSGIYSLTVGNQFSKIKVLAFEPSKKTRSIDLFCRRLKVSNCTSWHGRAEEYAGSAHCSVSRATAPLTDLWTWHERMAAPPRQHTPSDSTGTTWPDGLVCLKGGDLSAEVGQLQIDYPGVEIEDIRLKDFASGSYFATKSIIVVVKRQ